MLTCLPRIALCKGVLPNESGVFTSANETKNTTLFKLAVIQFSKPKKLPTILRSH